MKRGLDNNRPKPTGKPPKPTSLPPKNNSITKSQAHFYCRGYIDGFKRAESLAIETLRLKKRRTNERAKEKEPSRN